MHDFWNDRGPIWIDPRQYRVGEWYDGRTWTTAKIITDNVTHPYPPAPAPVDEERIRKIVREEMSDLVKPDIPAAPPEDWNG